MIGKTLYDVSMDEMRVATQEDVDRYRAWLSTLGLAVRALKILQPDLVPESGPGFDKRFDTILRNFLGEGSTA